MISQYLRNLNPDSNVSDEHLCHIWAHTNAALYTYTGTHSHIVLHAIVEAKIHCSILFALCTLLNTLAATATTTIHIATYSYCIAHIMLQHHEYWCWQQICKAGAGFACVCLTLVLLAALCAYLVVCFIVVIVVIAVSMCTVILYACFCARYTHIHTHTYEWAAASIHVLWLFPDHIEY